jgi:hypothetical protein
MPSITLYTLLSFVLALAVKAQQSPIPIGPYLLCGTTSTTCPTGSCCGLGSCCGTGCCDVQHVCVGEGTASVGCCDLFDSTLCGFDVSLFVFFRGGCDGRGAMGPSDWDGDGDGDGEGMETGRVDTRTRYRNITTKNTANTQTARLLPTNFRPNLHPRPDLHGRHLQRHALDLPARRLLRRNIRELLPVRPQRRWIGRRFGRGRRRERDKHDRRERDKHDRRGRDKHNRRGRADPNARQRWRWWCGRRRRRFHTDADANTDADTDPLASERRLRCSFEPSSHKRRQWLVSCNQRTSLAGSHGYGRFSRRRAVTRAKQWLSGSVTECRDMQCDGLSRI